MNHKRHLNEKFFFLFLAFLFVGIAGFSLTGSPLIFLPGTQPGSVDPVQSVTYCRSCHQSGSLSRPVSIVADWSGSMMSQSARDPMFYAAVAVTNKYHSTSGEWCIRCHSPTGWLAGHSKIPTGESLVGTDLDGVQCDYCHRAVDPLHPDSTVPFLTFPIPGYGNAMQTFQRFGSSKRGPYDSVLASHETFADSFQRKSEFCAVCHDVSNPFYATDRITQAPYEYAPIERTYSEWLLSSFSSMGDSGTCQSCHMVRAPGYGASVGNAPHRNDLATHDLTGGNTFIPDILPDIWSGLDTTSLQMGKLRAINTLQRAANLDVIAFRLRDTIFASVRVTNLTGHKLPTGYPEGRRMWLNIVARNSSGSVVFESGMYEPDSAKLVFDGQIKIYETHHGVTDSTAARFGIPPGFSFHFGLNDTILFDNRIPPRGFTNTSFTGRHAEPVGYTYADSQYWDISKYVLPSSTTQVTATLFYQTVRREYVEFLRNENVDNPNDFNQWGKKLYDAWALRGKSTPVIMDSTTTIVRDSILDVKQTGNVPLRFELFQNYPNPFNPSTNISYQLQAGSYVSLKVFDVLGREVATLVSERKEPGKHEVPFDARHLSSGVYVYQLSAGSFTVEKKMLLLR